MTGPPPEGAREFFRNLPNLFQEANKAQWELYEETLYLMRRPITFGNFHAVRRFVGGAGLPKQAFLDRRVHVELESVLSSAVYPDASAVSLLEPFTDGSAELATALLHFNNPAYPIYDAATVGGLQQVGFDRVRYVSTIEGDTTEEYQKFIDVIQILKDAAPYQAIPEKNYYLTRIIQEGLWRLGLEQPATESRDRPRPTLR